MFSMPSGRFKNKKFRSFSPSHHDVSGRYDTIKIIYYLSWFSIAKKKERFIWSHPNEQRY